MMFNVSGDPSGTVCPQGMFRCAEGKCIPSLLVCNYLKDCEKGEDEHQSCRKCFFFFGTFVSSFGVVNH